jgi:hypothetical protein
MKILVGILTLCTCVIAAYITGLVIINNNMPDKNIAPYIYKGRTYEPTIKTQSEIIYKFFPENRNLFANGWVVSDNNSTRFEGTEYWYRDGFEWKLIKESYYREYSGTPYPYIEFIETR